MKFGIEVLSGLYEVAGYKAKRGNEKKIPQIKQPYRKLKFSSQAVKLVTGPSLKASTVFGQTCSKIQNAFPFGL